MSVSDAITRLVDFFYIPPIRSLIPHRLFRYGACGALNMTLDSVWYFLIYHFIVCKRFIDIGFVTISPHIASLIVVFPITFFTGFWLNRNVAFKATELKTTRQLMRYALTVAGAILLNYLCMKLLVDMCGVWATPAKSITTVVSAVYSFLAARYYTFRDFRRI
ncbi:MAG: GtrA family protein [Alistipes sp.]|nr:GtrA family protein [Alistipes sp.]